MLTSQVVTVSDVRSRSVCGSLVEALRLTRKAALFAGVAIAAAPTMAMAQSAPATDVPSSGLEEIIVTAQRREQNLQQVPIAVSVLSEDTLKGNRIVDVRDLNSIAPNVSVRQGPGGQMTPNYTIRGLLTQGGILGNDKGVALYLDGVFTQGTIGSIFQLADIERIEILKGPQGTLFGRNATGGAISIVTRDPKGEFGVEQTFTYGNYNHLRSKTRINLPALGPISASFSYMHSERDGDIRNLGAGTAWNYGPATGGLLGVRVSPARLGDDNTDAFVVALRLEANERLSFSYKFDYAKMNYTPDGSGTLQLLPSYGFVIPPQPNPAILTPVSLRRPDAVNAAYSVPNESLNRGHNFTTNWQVNDNISIKNILAHRSYRVSTSQQFDSAGGLIRGGQPFIIFAGALQEHGRQWSNEFVVNIDTKLAHLTAGYMFFDSRQTRGIPGYLDPTFTNVPNFTLAPMTSGLVHAHIRSQAFYGQSELHVTDQLDLVAGYRLTMDRKTEDNFYDTTRPKFSKYSKNKPTWLLGVNYKLNDNIFTYIKYSTGYISGGTSFTIDYDPELSRSWEAGVKADLFDSRLRSNLVVFSVDYTAIQAFTSSATLGRTADLGAVFVAINGGNAKAKGFEWENTAVPLDGLTLTGNVGYTDFKWTSVSPLLGQFTYGAYRPEWTGSVAAQYEISGMPAESRLVLRVDANFRSKMHMDNIARSPSFDAVMTSGAATIINARVALSDIKFLNGSAELALWARNLTNDDHPTNGGNFGILLAAWYERARTFGVDLSFKF